MKASILITASLIAASLMGCGLRDDAVKLDPSRYTVDFENDHVRVVRARYGPHEKSVMHAHRHGVVVHLTDVHGRFTFPDGATQEVTRSAGSTEWIPGVTHLPENLSDSPLEVIIVEVKR